jgi:hypothetical protein
MPVIRAVVVYQSALSGKSVILCRRTSKMAHQQRLYFSVACICFSGSCLSFTRNTRNVAPRYLLSDEQGHSILHRCGFLPHGKSLSEYIQREVQYSHWWLPRVTMICQKQNRPNIAVRAVLLFILLRLVFDQAMRCCCISFCNTNEVNSAFEVFHVYCAY